MGCPSWPMVHRNRVFSVGTMVVAMKTRKCARFPEFSRWDMGVLAPTPKAAPQTPSPHSANSAQEGSAKQRVARHTSPPPRSSVFGRGRQARSHSTPLARTHAPAPSTSGARRDLCTLTDGGGLRGNRDYKRSVYNHHYPKNAQDAH